jgi:transcriptional regulator of acetoin/glycerol metabolism
MPLSLQSRLLRVLQEREVTPLGGTRPVPVNFVLICASHRNLPEPGEAVTQDLLPPAIRQAQPTRATASVDAGLQAITRDAMMSAVRASGGNISRAARSLGIHRSTIHRHLQAANS